jgi:hypothetical protein
MEEARLNSEKIWKIWKKSKLNSEKHWKKSKLKCEKKVNTEAKQVEL